MTPSTPNWADAYHPVPGVPHIGMWRPACPLRISVADTSLHPPLSPDDERRWADICAANPRAHNGEILAVGPTHHAQSIIACARDQYKRLAVQTSRIPPPEGIWILGVKGWITALDHHGHEHLLIARRGAQTRVYADLWESAPAGGVEPPRHGVHELNVAALAESLAIEGEEELGITLDTRDAQVIGICRDYFAGSDDIFISLRLPDPIDPRRTPACQHGRCGWEYSDFAWLSRADAPAFDARPKAAIIPPTRAIMRLTGWIPLETPHQSDTRTPRIDAPPAANV